MREENKNAMAQVRPNDWFQLVATASYKKGADDDIVLCFNIDEALVEVLTHPSEEWQVHLSVQ